MHTAVLLVIPVILATALVTSAQPTTREYSRDAGERPQGASSSPGPSSQPAPHATLARVEELLRDKQAAEAKKLAIRWVLAHPRDAQRDRGLYLIAQAYYQYGNRIRAFYYLDELMDTYPESAYYGAALELQYQIADRYLDGYKRRFLRIPMFGAHDEAVEMLFRVQQRSPGSQLAERALLRTANYYYRDEQYDFAADTYSAYLRTYPRSPITPRVKLRQAYSMYAQFRGPRFDATPAIDAREQLRELTAQYPELARQENLPQLIEQIDHTLANKLFVTADFYQRTSAPLGAAYIYRYVAKAYPQTPEAASAELALKELPPEIVEKTPEPAITPGYAPGTPLTTPRMLPADPPQPDRPGVFEKEDRRGRPTFR